MIGVGGSVWTPVINRPFSASLSATLPTTLATSITHGGVTFFFDQAVFVGNYLNGPAFAVVPTGSINMFQPTPFQGTIDGGITNGAMLNPQANEGQAFDQRPSIAGAQGASFNLARLQQTWPLEVVADDILLKGISSTDPLLDVGDAISMRRGVIEQYGGLFIVSEVPRANSLAPSAVGWTGRGTPQASIINVDAIDATAKSIADAGTYDTTGMDKPSTEDIINRFNKYFPVLPLFGEDPYGHRLYAPKGIGLSYDLYGLYIAGAMHQGMLMRYSPEVTDEQRRTLTIAAASHGINFFDAYEGSGTEQKPNGGLYQFAFPLMALALSWRGDTDKLATLRSSYGGNYRQAFTFTAEQAAQLTPHDSYTEPYTWRRRNLDAISGTTFTIETYRVGSEGDNTKGSFFNLFVTNGTVSTLVTGTESGDNIDASATGQFDITVTDATGFSVNDTIWFEPYATPTEGMSEWVIEGTSIFNQYSPVSAGYRQLNEWSGGVAALLIEGVWHSEWDPVRDYVLGANTANYPSSGYSWPTHHNDTFGAFEQEFWDAYVGTFGVDADNVPAKMADPVVTATGASTLSVDHADSTTIPNGTRGSVDARYSTDGDNWVEETGISDPQTLSNLFSSTAYEVQTAEVDDQSRRGPWSDSTPQTTQGIPAGAPDQMAAPTVVETAFDTVQVTLAADPADNGSAITSRDIFWSLDQVKWTLVSGVTSPHDITGLDELTTVYVKARAVNGVAPGEWSTTASDTTRPEPSAIVVDEGASTGTFTSAGGYRIWTATDGDQLVVTTGDDVNALVVAGGGGGGHRRGGAGGAGEVVIREATGTPLTLSATTYTAVVGAGGTSGGSGSNSTFAGLTALGGGFGGTISTGGDDGGSGGGSGGGSNAFGASIASDGVGNDGGPDNTNANCGGGGGGATQAGQMGATNLGGEGGDGIASPVPGESGYYGGGGGGGAASANVAPGGLGGGGDGSANGVSLATDGTAGTGGGGGGGGDASSWRGGGDGGSGTVKVWWSEAA